MKTKRAAFTGFGVTLFVLFGFAIFLNLNFHSVIVDGQSMLPTLTPGQKVWVSKAYWLVGPIHDGDVVVMKDPTADTGFIIKRVFRMGGETVPVDKWPFARRLAQGTYTVPTGTVYVLGDNQLKGMSEDSRFFGPVRQETIIGKVIVKR
jgi:signal peptidase I